MTSIMRTQRQVSAAALVRVVQHASGDLELEDTRVVGDVNLEGLTFSGRVVLRRCTFVGRVIVKHAHFTGVVELVDVEFADDLDAESAHFDSDLVATRVALETPKVKMLGNIVVTGDFIATEIAVRGIPVPDHPQPLSFNSARFMQSFELGGQIGAGIDGVSASVATGLVITLGSVIDGTTSLDGIKVGGTLWLMGVTFGGPVTLVSAIVAEQCYLVASRFRQNLSCNAMTITGHLAADRIECDGRVRFVNATVGRTTRLRRCVFKQGAELDGASFGADVTATGSVFKGLLRARGTKFVGAFFGASRDQDVHDPGWWGTKPEPHWTSGAWFEAGATFVDTTWQATANFGSGPAPQAINTNQTEPGDGTAACRCADELRFQGCQFAGELRLDQLVTTSLAIDWCTFARQIDVSAIGGLSHLELKRSSADRICFPDDASALQSVALQGTTFTSVTGDVARIMDKMAASDAIGIHMLEQAVRLSGNISAADDLAIAEKRKELERFSANGNGVRLAWSRLYGLVARWGIRPWPLLLVLVLPVLGMFLFHGNGAVTKAAAQATSGAEPQQPQRVHLNLADAALVSFDEFLPVDFARSKQYTPTDTAERIIPFLGWTAVPADAYATVLALAGWLLVPIGVTVLGGALRRSPS